MADVQFALEASPMEAATLSIAVLQARLRDPYGISGQRLKDLSAL